MADKDERQLPSLTDPPIVVGDTEWDHLEWVQIPLDLKTDQWEAHPIPLPDNRGRLPEAKVVWLYVPWTNTARRAVDAALRAIPSFENKNLLNINRRYIELATIQILRAYEEQLSDHRRHKIRSELSDLKRICAQVSPTDQRIRDLQRRIHRLSDEGRMWLWAAQDEARTPAAGWRLTKFGRSLEFGDPPKTYGPAMEDLSLPECDKQPFQAFMEIKELALAALHEMSCAGEAAEKDTGPDQSVKQLVTHLCAAWDRHSPSAEQCAGAARNAFLFAAADRAGVSPQAVYAVLRIERGERQAERERHAQGDSSLAASDFTARLDGDEER